MIVKAIVFHKKIYPTVKQRNKIEHEVESTDKYWSCYNKANEECLNKGVTQRYNDYMQQDNLDASYAQWMMHTIQRNTWIIKQIMATKVAKWLRRKEFSLQTVVNFDDMKHTFDTYINEVLKR